MYKSVIMKISFIQGLPIIFLLAKEKNTNIELFLSCSNSNRNKTIL